MDEVTYQRKRQMVRAILQENPDLAAAIQAADEEGAAEFEGAYVPGLDFIVDTLEESLLLEPETFHDMRQTMVHYCSIAAMN